MAVGPYVLSNQLANVQQVFNGLLAETMLRSNPSVARLIELGMVEYGKKVERLRWSAVSDGFPDPSTILDSGTLPGATREEITPVLLNWTIYIELLRFGRLLQMGVTPEEYFLTAQGATLMANEITRVIPIISRGIHKHIVKLGSNGATDLTSLGDAIANQGNTYAGIDRTTATFWQPYLNEGAGNVNRSVTIALLEDMVNNLVENREAVIGEVWSGATAWDATRTLIKTDSPSRNVDPEVLRGGASRIFWNDIPFIKMPGMDTNAQFWMDFVSGEGIKLLFQHEKDFLIKDEHTNSYDTRVSVAAHPQLKVHNPWKQGCLRDLI